ncbi:MAG: signal peptidase I [Solirubrobacterales bacterium]|nr:signal peptidase I [Solirubrobacterales bacterium]
MSAAQQKKDKSTANSILELIVIVAVALGLALLIQAFVVKPYRIPSESMVPTLQVGQRVLVNRLTTRFGEPSVGDVTVFHPPAGSEQMPLDQCGQRPQQGAACDSPTPQESNINFIKRIVGGPGDTISIIKGRVIRNGKTTSEPFISDTCANDNGAACTLPKTITIPPGHWFMMGDNRGESDDSRFWGPVPTAWIIGPAFATYWPPSRINIF